MSTPPTCISSCSETNGRAGPLSASQKGGLGRGDWEFGPESVVVSEGCEWCSTFRLTADGGRGWTRHFQLENTLMRVISPYLHLHLHIPCCNLVLLHAEAVEVDGIVALVVALCAIGGGLGSTILLGFIFNAEDAGDP